MKNERDTSKVAVLHSVPSHAAAAALLLLALRFLARGAVRQLRYGLAGWWGVPDWIG